MGAEREGRHGVRVRRVARRKAVVLRAEARRTERRGGSAVHDVLHRRERRHGHRRRGRRRHAFFPERAGQPPPRDRGEGADAGAVRLRRGAGVHEAGV